MRVEQQVPLLLRLRAWRAGVRVERVGQQVLRPVRLQALQPEVQVLLPLRLQAWPAEVQAERVGQQVLIPLRLQAWRVVLPSEQVGQQMLPPLRLWAWRAEVQALLPLHLWAWRAVPPAVPLLVPVAWQAVQASLQVQELQALPKQHCLHLQVSQVGLQAVQLAQVARSSGGLLAGLRDLIPSLAVMGE